MELLVRKGRGGRLERVGVRSAGCMTVGDLSEALRALPPGARLEAQDGEISLTGADFRVRGGAVYVELLGEG